MLNFHEKRPKMKKIILSLVLSSILLLVACRKDQTEKGVVFRLALGSDITSTNPIIMEDNNSFTIALNAFEGLFRLNPKTAEAELGLAESYTQSEDGLVIIFTLRENLRFSDGAPLSAQTIVDSWHYTLNPKNNSPTAYMMADILENGNKVISGELPLEALGVKALDERTLEVRLAFPAPYANSIFALPLAVALPMHLVKEHPETWNHTYPIVSNGPFVISSWRPSSQVVLEKNHQYHSAHSVQVDKIIVYTLDDMNTAYNMYLNREIDFLALVSPDKIAEAQRRNDYHSDPYTNGYYFLYNTERAPLNDMRVRRALAKAIDRKTLTDRILRGGQRPLYAVIAQMPGYRSQDYLKESVSEAQRLLAEAGFPQGEGFPSLTLAYNTSENNKKIAEFVQQQWKQNLGINISLQNQEWKTFLGTRSSFDYDIIRMGWLPDYPDPLAMLHFFSSEGGFSNYRNQAYDDMLRQSSQIADPQSRIRALEMAEAHIMRDLPFVPVLSENKNSLFDANKWEGLHNNPANIVMFRELQLKE
jgi:oligopeptide transport system substrate-binding protein